MIVRRLEVFLECLKNYDEKSGCGTDSESGDSQSSHKKAMFTRLPASTFQRTPLNNTFSRNRTSIKRPNNILAATEVLKASNNELPLNEREQSLKQMAADQHRLFERIKLIKQPVLFQPNRAEDNGTGSEDTVMSGCFKGTTNLTRIGLEDEQMEEDGRTTPIHNANSSFDSRLKRRMNEMRASQMRSSRGRPDHSSQDSHDVERNRYRNSPPSECSDSEDRRYRNMLKSLDKSTTSLAACPNIEPQDKLKMYLRMHSDASQVDNDTRSKTAPKCAHRKLNPLASPFHGSSPSSSTSSFKYKDAGGSYSEDNAAIPTTSNNAQQRKSLQHASLDSRLDTARVSLSAKAQEWVPAEVKTSETQHDKIWKAARIAVQQAMAENPASPNQAEDEEDHRQRFKAYLARSTNEQSNLNSPVAVQPPITSINAARPDCSILSRARPPTSVLSTLPNRGANAHPGSCSMIISEDPVQKAVDKIIEQSSKIVRVSMNMVVPRSDHTIRHPAWKELAKLTLQPPHILIPGSMSGSGGLAIQQDPFQKAILKLNRSPAIHGSDEFQNAFKSQSAKPTDELPEAPRIEPNVSGSRSKVIIRDPVSAKPIVLPKSKPVSITKITVSKPHCFGNIEAPELPIVADWLNTMHPLPVYPLLPIVAPSPPYFKNGPQCDRTVPPLYQTETGYHGGWLYGGVDDAISFPLHANWAAPQFHEIKDFLYPPTEAPSGSLAFPAETQDFQNSSIRLRPVRPQVPPNFIVTSPPVSARTYLSRGRRKGANRPHAAAIQQKLEYMIYQKKEKEALAKKQQSLAPPMTSLSEIVDWNRSTTPNLDLPMDFKDSKENADFTKMINLKTKSKSDDLMDMTSRLKEMLRPGSFGF